MTSGSSNYESKGEQLKDPAQIASLINRLKTAHTLLAVVVHGANGQFNSVVVDVNPKQGYLLLDELNPKLGHEHLLKSRRMRVNAQMRGVLVQFDADLDAVEEDEGGRAYRVAIPSTLYYMQRRAYFRAALGRISTSIPISVRLPPHDLIAQGFLIDLSAGGLRARFPMPANQAPHLRLGDELPGTVLKFSKDELFKCRLEVRFAGYSEDSGELMLGCRFMDLERQQQKQIERQVMAMQREQLKKGNRV